VCDAVLLCVTASGSVHQYAGSVRLIFIDESARDDRYHFFGALIVDAAALRSVETGLDEAAASLARSVPGFDPSTEFHFATYSLNRDRTVPERDRRAARTTARIARAVRSITVDESIRCPPDARRPAQGRGVGWVREV
jgi:hypothetical protein